MAERTRNGTASTAAEFHRNIRDHLRYFQSVGSCPVREREMEDGGEGGKRGKRKRQVDTGGGEWYRHRGPISILKEDLRPSCAIRGDPRGSFSPSAYAILRTFLRNARELGNRYSSFGKYPSRDIYFLSAGIIIIARLNAVFTRSICPLLK